MIRETSIEAYRTIKEKGLLSKRRLEVYEQLYEYGPMTAGQIGRRMVGYRSAVSTADRNIHARLTELRDAGCIKELGEKKCPVTGMLVIVWDVTTSLPRLLNKEIKETRNEKIKRLEQALREISETTTDMFSRQLALEALEWTNKI